jgi:hypothetical protein
MKGWAETGQAQPTDSGTRSRSLQRETFCTEPPRYLNNRSPFARNPPFLYPSHDRVPDHGRQCNRSGELEPATISHNLSSKLLSHLIPLLALL